jgi:hypothetical protein
VITWANPPGSSIASILDWWKMGCVEVDNIGRREQRPDAISDLGARRVALRRNGRVSKLLAPCFTLLVRFGGRQSEGTDRDICATPA